MSARWLEWVAGESEYSLGLLCTVDGGEKEAENEREKQRLTRAESKADRESKLQWPCCQPNKAKSSAKRTYIYLPELKLYFKKQKRVELSTNHHSTVIKPNNVHSDETYDCQLDVNNTVIIVLLISEVALAINYHPKQYLNV